MLQLISQLVAQQTTNGGGTAVAASGAFFIIFLIIAIAASVFWIWMLIDCLSSNKPGTEKLIWVLVIFSFIFWAHFCISRSVAETAGAFRAASKSI